MFPFKYVILESENFTCDMEIVWSLPYLALLIWLVPKIPFFRQSGLSTLGLRLFFGLKAITGVGLILVYSYYYPPGSADVFNYFEDGQILFSALTTEPLDYFRMVTGIGSDAPHLMYYYDQMSFWLKDFNYNLFNDNKTVIRFNALVMLFSFKNIYVHTYFMNLFSLAGLVGIFRFLHQIIRTSKSIALIVVVLPPSLLFWGSGLLKEGIVIFALGILLYAITKIINHPGKLSPYLALIFALALFSISKFYVLFAILPALISYFIARKTGKNWLSFVGIHLVLLALIFLLPTLGFPDIPELISRKQNDFINYVNSLNHVGSYIESPMLTSNFWDFIIQGFRGLFITLFRPHPLEVHNMAMIPAAFENLLTLILIVTALILRNKQIKIRAFLFQVSFAVILFALAGMTTPVLGALVRYKIPAQPFLYGLLLMGINWKVVEQFLSRFLPDYNQLRNKLNSYLFKNEAIANNQN